MIMSSNHEKPMKTLSLKYDNFLLFAFIWVMLVSMLDHYLTIKLQDSILTDEKNPLGVALINADGGSVALFMTMKMTFLWLIAAILVALYQYRKWAAYAGVTVLCIAQTLLLSYFLTTPEG